MPDFREMFNGVKKWFFYLLSIYVLGWGFTSYKSAFLGLILGTCFSFLMLWMLVRRTVKFDQAITNGKKVRSLGSLQRMAMAGIAIAISLRFPRFFTSLFVVFGLMTFYTVIMIKYFYHALHVHK